LDDRPRYLRHYCNAGSGAASEAGAFWMIVLDISVITAMQAGYIGGTAVFVAVAD
jgi:hypothetical protein